MDLQTFLIKKRGPKPWDPGLTEEEETALWAQLVASDFYFCSREVSSSEYRVLINPRLYFHERPDLIEDMDISSILPSNVEHVEGYEYRSSAGWLTLCATMESMGFEHNNILLTRAT